MESNDYRPAPSTYARSLGYKFPDEQLRLGNQPLEDLLAVGDLVEIHHTAAGEYFSRLTWTTRAIVAEISEPIVWTENGIDYPTYAITYQRLRHDSDQLPRLLSGEALHRSTTTGYLDDLVAIDGRILSLYPGRDEKIILIQRGAARPKQLTLF